METYKNYTSAYDALDKMLTSPDDSEMSRYRNYTRYNNNNIIAFCGGDSVSNEKAAMDFVETVYRWSVRRDRVTELPDLTEKLRYTSFSEPIVIDPYMFNESSSIVYVILAEMFQRFQRQMEDDINGRGYNSRSEMCYRMELMNIFEKAFLALQTVANQKTALEENYDDDGNLYYCAPTSYDGALGTLTKLSEGASLQDTLKDLIDKYLRFMNDNSGNYRDNERKLLLVINNFGECDKDAHKASEYIRKYLSLPNVVIVMSVDLDQLKLGIAEYNYTSFKFTLKSGDTSAINRVSNMSDSYILKLLPMSSRVYVQS